MYFFVIYFVLCERQNLTYIYCLIIWHFTVVSTVLWSWLLFVPFKNKQRLIWFYSYCTSQKMYLDYRFIHRLGLVMVLLFHNAVY